MSAMDALAFLVLTRTLVCRLALLFCLVLMSCAPAPRPSNSTSPVPTAEVNAQSKILQLKGAIGAHDPVIIKADGKYYRFITGPGIPIGCSPDLITWTECGRVFNQLPVSIYKAVPKVQELWAPDISFFNGKYYLYYSGSSFGSNQSAIALATNTTLDSLSKEYKWVDEGVIVQSQPSYSFNAIDPNFVMAQDGSAWLAFGSYWTGIKLQQLDPKTGKALPDTQLHALAQRFENNGSIEASFIVYRAGYYYLFVSFDFCCQGVNSTYNIRVGRSKEITGPYIDQSAKKMLAGGGTLLLGGKNDFRGPGHNAILIEGEKYYLIYHVYDVKSNGTPLLHIEELRWDIDGWPSAPSQSSVTSVP